MSSDLTPARLANMIAMDDTDLIWTLQGFGWTLQGFGCASFRALAARVIELEGENARLREALGGMPASFPVSWSVAQTDAVITARDALETAHD